MTQKKSLPMSISVKDTDLFKGVLETITEFLHDGRIPDAIRIEYGNKICKITEKATQ